MTFWRGKRVLVTGHTGFKGSWLSLWLDALGAEVHGYALAPPTEPSLYRIAGVEAHVRSTLADIRDAQAVRATVARVAPEIVFHLAAQPLVRHSYAAPVETYATNVLGTVHLLEAVRQVGGVRAVINVTTDKCYENNGGSHGYREHDPMGGHDPYSSSKACSELVTAAYRQSYFSRGPTALASARAGNVIGGGDWARDRLVPDALAAFAAGAPVKIRNPLATRPWQHVLEPLSGYLTLAEALWHEGQAVAAGWNFGPAPGDARPVDWVVTALARLWGGDARWQLDEGAHPHEARDLTLDITQARTRLGWSPRWGLDTALEKVVAWQRQWLDGADMARVCLEQISSYPTERPTPP